MIITGCGLIVPEAILEKLEPMCMGDYTLQLKIWADLHSNNNSLKLKIAKLGEPAWARA